MEKDINDDPWMDLEAVARHTDMSRSFWEKMRVLGKGPKFVKLGRSVRTRRSWVDAYVEALPCAFPGTPPDAA